MAVLITGATGHVGYAVVRWAAARGRSVVATYHAGMPEAQARALGPGVSWVACDLADRAAVERLAEAHEIDACIHLAAISNEAYARPDPAAAVHVNVGATANLLEAGRQRGWRRFILVSTGGVFQNVPAHTPILEDAHPNPSNIYGSTKYAAELVVAMYRAQFGMEASAVRISWVYGPPVVSDSPARGPIPSLLMTALRGEARRDPSGGDFAASFTFVADVAEGLLAAADAPRLRHAIYHLGPGRNYTAREVAQAIEAAVPGAVIELGPGCEPWTAFTAMRGPLAGSRFVEDTGYAVRHGLVEGIAVYAEWMRANPHVWRRDPRTDAPASSASTS